MADSHRQSSNERRLADDRRADDRRRRSGGLSVLGSDRRQVARRAGEGARSWRRRLLEEIRQLTIIRRLRLGRFRSDDREVRHIDDMIAERRRDLGRRP